MPARSASAGRDPAKNPQAVRRAIGVTGQFSAVDGYLTGRENLMLMADLHLLPKDTGRRRAEELLERFELTEAGDKPASTYSGGMKRKLDLAMTLVGNPKVIFLDEPTTGLDPRSRRTMWDIIRGLVAEGTTILLTTQYLEEADQLAHRVAVLDGGRIVAEGTPAELKARIPGGHIELAFADRAELDAAATVLAPTGRDDDALTLQLAGDGRVSRPADAAAAAGRRLGRGRGAYRAHPRSRRRLLRPHRQEGSLTMSTMTMDDTGLDTGDTRSHALVHARIMLRRNLRHMQRYPSLTLMITLMPLVFLLLFVYVFGGTLGSGLGSGMPAGLHGGRAAYADYVAPAIILLAVAAAAQGTAIAVAQDMTEGIIARFRTMAVARSSVLTGHVVGATIQTLIGVVVVTAAALAVGFRPHANAAEWLAAFGVVLLLTFAVTWLCVGLGLSAKSVETASNSPMFLILLPFLGSGFVPTSSLPAGMRWFAEYEPFTPVNETLRGLLTGTKIGDNLVITIAWCAGVAVLSYAWSRRLYEREPKPL